MLSNRFDVGSAEGNWPHIGSMWAQLGGFGATSARCSTRCRCDSSHRPDFIPKAAHVPLQGSEFG
ncbi:MAG: hypothetical protein IJP70_02615 [Bacteroidales bacterium]|nr:hypothetical protein [Bacteroidales bacterium]